MDGFIKVHIVGQGQDVTCWQKIAGGVVVDYVDITSNSVSIPAIREEIVDDPTLLTQPQ